MIPLVEVLTRTESWLRQRGIPSPRLEAELLMCRVLGLERVQLYLQHDRPLGDEELTALRPLVARRGRREPLAWLLQTQAFHAIDLQIIPGVLVPRPDTETLVEATLECIGDVDETVFVADIGCGSGAIGLALAKANEHLRIYAVDRSPEALTCTRANVEALNLKGRVGVLSGDLLTPIPLHRPIDWIVSNPPYIAREELETLEPEVSKWEPRLALAGGQDGLDIYRRLIPIARQRARSGLMLEVGHTQASRVHALMQRAGFNRIRTWQDLGGIVRVVGGRIPGSTEAPPETSA